MNKEYYNVLEFNRAFSLMKVDPFEAKERFEEYFKKYPKDYSSYPFYISVLVSLGLFDEAEKLLNYVEEMVDLDKDFINLSEKYERFRQNIIISKAKIFSYQERYEELFQLGMDNLEQFRGSELKSVFFYAKKKTDKLVLYDELVLSYPFRQIVEYSEDEFLEYVKKYMLDYREEDDSLSVFASEFPLMEILSEVKKYIPSDKRICFPYYHDFYIFRYDGCGRTNNKVVNYFKVVCFHNTNNILTMYPVTGQDNLPYVDLNYMIKEDNSSKIRRKSQIDRFNQRYKSN